MARMFIHAYKGSIGLQDDAERNFLTAFPIVGKSPFSITSGSWDSLS